MHAIHMITAHTSYTNTHTHSCCWHTSQRTLQVSCTMRHADKASGCDMHGAISQTFCCWHMLQQWSLYEDWCIEVCIRRRCEWIGVCFKRPTVIQVCYWDTGMRVGPRRPSNGICHCFKAVNNTPKLSSNQNSGLGIHKFTVLINHVAPILNLQVWAATHVTTLMLKCCAHADLHRLPKLAVHEKATCMLTNISSQGIYGIIVSCIEHNQHTTNMTTLQKWK